MPENFEKQQQQDDISIHAQNFGGLNTTSSVLNLPPEDSPAMLNVDVDISGNVTKREGTELILALRGKGMYIHPVRSVLGYDYLLMKRGTSLQVVSSSNRVTGALKTFLGVFNATAANERPNFTLISDIEPRVVILHPSAPPVHVKFVEQTMKLLSQPANTTTIVVPNAERFQYENPIVYVNRVYVGGLFSYNAGTKTLTITSTTPFSGNVTVDLVAPIWQWWAESLRWFGDRFYDVTSRFNVNKADQSVLLPEKLRSDMDNVNNISGKYPLLAYKSSVWNDLYTFADQPDTVNKYAWTDGAIYNYSATNYPNKAPYYATFSDARTPYPQVPESVSFLRQRELRFRNDTGIATNNLIVQVDKVQQAWQPLNVQTVTGTNPYNLYKADGTIESTSGNVARYIAFGTGVPIGVSPTAVVTLTNASPTFGGTSHLTVDTEYLSGSYFRVYGLGLWADYLNGFFPSLATVYQGRLVLSGFKNDPTRVVFSATSDSVEPGVKYNFFQVTDDLSDLATNPFDVLTTSSEADDYVTGLVEWQSSLFVLTRRATYRVSGGDQPISPSRRFVNFVSALGLVNSYCVCRTDSAVFYLSDSGVYNLTPRVADGEYEPIEKSLKIRKVFRNSINYDLAAWLSFDSVRKVLYVGLPRDNEIDFATGIYVYNTFRDSWTQYDTPGNFQTYMGTPYVDTLLGEGFLFCCEITAIASAALVRLYGKRYVDFLNISTPISGTNISYYDGSAYTWAAPYLGAPVLFDAFWDFMATPKVQAYKKPLTLQTLPYTNIQDLVVYKDAVKLKFGTEWVKTTDGIYLLKDPGTSRIIVIPRPPVNDTYTGQVTYGTGDKPSLVTWTNNIQRYDMTVGGIVDYANLLYETALSGVTLEAGYSYLSYYQTPLFVQQFLGTLKKVKHAYMYFDNEPVTATYQVSDLASGQSVDSLVGTYKVDANASITITYDNDSQGVSSNDIYGFEELVWDDATFDETPTAQQSDRYSLFKERLLGVGYGYQLGVWSYDAATFKLCAYQIDAKAAGKRFTNRRS